MVVKNPVWWYVWLLRESKLTSGEKLCICSVILCMLSIGLFHEVFIKAYESRFRGPLRSGYRSTLTTRVGGCLLLRESWAWLLTCHCGLCKRHCPCFLLEKDPSYLRVMLLRNIVGLVPSDDQICRIILFFEAVSQ